MYIVTSLKVLYRPHESVNKYKKIKDNDNIGAFWCICNKSLVCVRESLCQVKSPFPGCILGIY